MSIILFTALFLLGLYLWKTDKGGGWLTYLFIAGGLLITEILETVSQNILQLTDDQYMIGYYLFQSVRAVIGILLIVVILRDILLKLKDRGKK